MPGSISTPALGTALARLDAGRPLRPIDGLGWMAEMKGMSTERASASVGDTTGFLNRMAAGDAAARDEVFKRLYAELHRIACRVTSRSHREGTLQATDLIGEAYERLVRRPEDGWNGRSHFLATAARAMKQVLIDHVRARKAEKRGGDRVRVGALNLDQLAASYEERTGGLLEFDVELEKLRKERPKLAQVVDLRFFGGLSIPAIAEVTGTPVRSIERRWADARAWLRASLE